MDLVEQLQREPRIRFRLIPAHARQLVVLHQPVVWVARECERRQQQRVDDREFEERHPRQLHPKERQIVGENVVAEHDLGASGERLDAEPAPVGVRDEPRLVPIPSDHADLGELARSGFDVERDDAGAEGGAPGRRGIRRRKCPNCPKCHV